MAAVTFDTHKFIRRLRDAGINETQAEAIAEAIRDVQQEAEPVTRDYLDAKLEAAKADIIKWLAGLLLGQAALVAALVKLF